MIEHLTTHYFCDTVLLSQRPTIMQVGAYSPRTAEEGKKLRWSDGFAAAWCLVKYRFVD